MPAAVTGGGNAGAGAEIEENKVSPLSSLGNTDVLRQISLILALAISLAIAVFLMIWAQEPAYRPLGQMETQELIDTLDFLDQQKLPYKLEGNTLSVPEDRFSDIRLMLTRNGLGPARQQQDFLNQDSGFGVSQRMEQARLKHSQEQTLASAVEELRSVQRARVILALPQQNVFARQQREPSATVVVTLNRGSELRQSEVDAIVDIVASAVHGLKPARVTVTDQHGRLLNSGSQDGISAQGRRELELRVQQEQLYREKIDSILIPVLGLGKYSAQVDVTMDFSAVEETSRRYNPDLPAVRSEMLIEDNQNGSGPVGIPGALTNQPPIASDIPQEVGGQGQDERLAQGRNRSEVTRNYELDSTISHTRQQVGTVRRVTLSVAVDYKSVPGADGVDTMQPLADNELANIRRLLMGSVGFNAARGDVLEVVSVPFAEDLALAPINVPIYEQAWFWRAVKYALGALGLFVLLMVVVRPMIKRLINPQQAKEEEAGANGLGALAELEDQYAAETLGLLSQSDGDYSYAEDGSILLPDLHKDDDMLRAIRALVANEPDLSTQVIKSWLNEDG
ncbi:flagellar M-ring protein FliF [Ferrimonas balearica]|nr:flagellar basal-body MS-ring/collar protein FliF [Ferrimonas balearica]MBY5921302.1 flagellar M-ring protein FliF [Ferrimonas balearica]MBY5996013.1 flagellar M-ring protein FliF [Ferrimonas balearica]